ncbi:MAG TPA: Hpt domain-containing protein [Anaerohalosphaeraceae bacterium]|nr:Hpt domain-containing protein [Phycisphaerae bacterium]HOK95300.1 Hpt domain-containing protein [Anaerohalosphaeraceae bacterium]HOL32105.1 Hpt domain-containing protein [Anaerohalosphaeraceae bacterium]HOM76361.1 Hpt domain-containing protein [Anaerohalosphaeraceae bacterium]HPC64197.1 Hpt domain-containing protein [Anaerohalosphaeraceae bacterium]
MSYNEDTIDDAKCPLNWDDVYGRIGDESIIEEFAGAFLKNSLTLMLSLKSAVASISPEQIELYAHALKGSASNMGAIALAKKAWRLEKAAAEKKLDNVGELFAAVKKEYLDLKEFFENPDWIARAKQMPAKVS